MTSKKILLIAATLTGCCVLGAFALKEVHVAWEQLPAAVQTTILREAAGAPVTEIEMETRDGTTTYEAEFVADGQETEIQVAMDGTLLGREVEGDDDDDDDGENENAEQSVSVDQLPAAAHAAFLKFAANAPLSELKRERKHGADVYEAQWTANGTLHEVSVTAEGAMVESEDRITVATAPPAVQAAIVGHFPAGADLVVEMKTIVLYEVETTIDGKERELLILPTGRVVGGDDGDDDGNDDGDDDGHDDNDDDDR